MDFSSRTALITGASSGLGIEYATRLASRGADVVLVARREKRLRDLAERIRSEHRVHATVIPADLSLPRGRPQPATYTWRTRH